VRVVFLGTPAAAVPPLHALIEAGHDLALVVTQPDRPSGRSRRPLPPPVKQAALDRGLELFQPGKVRNTAFRERLAACRPDLLVVVAYGRILPARVLALGTGGAVNVHFSLLPAYRGAAPVQWALARGEAVTGVTTMHMNERMDEGDILLQQEVAIARDEHAPALEQRLARVGSALLVETLRRQEAGELIPRAQEHAKATLAPLLSRADGEITPELSAAEIEGRVRGFDPWPGVWLLRAGKRLRLVEVRALEGTVPDEPAGSLVELTREGLLMACGHGTRLLLLRVQPAGGKPLAARDAVNGRHVRVGDRLEAAAAQA
jgi:methionyl-tRNA formyltransferase